MFCFKKFHIRDRNAWAQNKQATPQTERKVRLPRFLKEHVAAAAWALKRHEPHPINQSQLCGGKYATYTFSCI